MKKGRKPESPLPGRPVLHRDRPRPTLETPGRPVSADTSVSRDSLALSALVLGISASWLGPPCGCPYGRAGCPRRPRETNEGSGWSQGCAREVAPPLAPGDS